MLLEPCKEVCAQPKSSPLLKSAKNEPPRFPAWHEPFAALLSRPSVSRFQCPLTPVQGFHGFPATARLWIPAHNSHRTFSLVHLYCPPWYGGNVIYSCLALLVYLKQRTILTSSHVLPQVYAFPASAHQGLLFEAASFHMQPFALRVLVPWIQKRSMLLSH